jgi:HK97 family phage major capsid protein
VSASMVGEATEADDNFPTFAQPAIAVKKAQAFLPFSIEIDMDFPALQSDLNYQLNIAKGELEDTQFTLGSGSGNNVNGLVTDLVAASTPIVTSTTSNAVALVDVLKLDQSLGQRFRRNAVMLTTRTLMNVVRALDTAGGAALWTQLPGGVPGQMLGYAVHEAPNMDSTYGSGENYVMILGDIGQAYKIIDRVGMVVDLIPHLFGNNNNYPTGQRGLYAYWRFGAKTVNTTAAKILNIT